MIYMTCDPYAEKPFPKILIDSGDGIPRPLTANSPLARVENSLLQENLYPCDGWKGFFQTVYSTFGVDSIMLEFRGCVEDFQLLEDAYNSFSKVIPKLTVNFVFDSQLAADISPNFRKDFLLRKLNYLKDTKQYWRWRSKNFDATLEQCIEILRSEKNSDVEKVLVCKSVLEEYFQKYFDEDEKYRLDCISLNQDRAKHFENDNCLSLKDSHERYQLLNGLYEHLKQQESTTVEEILKKVETAKWPEPDYSLAKIEINGEEGYWLEESDALLYIKKFQLAAQSCCKDLGFRIIDLWAETVETCLYNRSTYAYVENLDELYNDSYLKSLEERFRQYIWSKWNYFNVTQKKCVVIENIPSYWPGQEARKIVRTYIEVVKYEEEFLKEVQAKFSKQIDNYQESQISSIEYWRDDLKNYAQIINILETAKYFSERIKELREITEHLTSIDCRIKRETPYE